MNSAESGVRCRHCANVLRSIVALALLHLASSPVLADSVGGESPPVSREELASPAVKRLKLDYAAFSIPLQIQLAPVTEQEQAAVAAARSKDRPPIVGFARDLPGYYQGDLFPHLSWQRLPDKGLVAAFSIRSPGASAIRAGMRTEGLPQNAEVRIFGTNNAEIFGPYSGEYIRSQETPGDGRGSDSENRVFWSPVIEGDTIAVEIYLPSPAKDGFRLTVPKIQHLVDSIQHPSTKNLSDLGASGSCNIDVRCRSTVPANLSSAVAKYLFTKEGFTYLCTGTLLNDKDPNSWIPYFFTANHCLPDQSTANTIDSYWFFERAVCGGADPNSVTHFTGGADLLATDSSSDFSLLRLRDMQIGSLPEIHFAGWTSANPTGLGAIGIHHPGGDVKKLSEGTVNGISGPGQAASGVGDFLHVTWTAGTTEAGSSGSGAFAITGEQGGQHLLVGNLHSGLASCSNRSSPDWYARFSVAYPSIRQWLACGPSAAPALAGLTRDGQIFYTADLMTWENIPGQLTQLQLGDFTGDGKADLAGIASDQTIWYSSNFCGWTNLPGRLAQLRTGDLNGDGRADLAGVAGDGTIWYTTNLGGWTNIPGRLAQLRVGDINGDGRADLVGVASDGTIWYTTNLATWTNVPGNLAQLRLGDLNGDGRADLAGLASDGTIWYTTNLRTWTNVPGRLAQLRVGDLNGDGRADLAGVASDQTIWYTVALDTWTNIPGRLVQLRLAELNGDGRADIVGLASDETIWNTINLATWARIPGQLGQLVGDD